MSDEESVKVAVRVRPFNKRELSRNAKCIISMTGAATAIQNPDDADDERSFNFDYSYWSHDGGVERADGYVEPKPGSNFVGQQEVFDDIGQGVLKNAWAGFNTSLFAYGQTGSGKSWSVVGYGVNSGIVPRFCEEIFKGINKKKEEGDPTEYEVLFSMMEIYNERVRDLLAPPTRAKESLKVRQHPKRGFYAEGLLIEAVSDYEAIERRTEEGTKNRTVASTNMNATSSRAHTIVGVTFTQKGKNAAGEETAKSSVVNLVDLAGSERADSTGATGDRLKEGSAINQSLSSLGNVISALAERSEGKQVRVPYRDSVLTKLLKNALAGNSKTIMIAALSPADINYDETLSTLRYADRAKQIKTKATVNEDPTAKLIRDLQDENEKLKEMLTAGGGAPAPMKSGADDDDDDDEDDNEGLTEEEVKARVEEELAARMAENERQMADMQKAWQEKLDEAKAKNSSTDIAIATAAEERKTRPHLYNLNMDPMLTGMIVHILQDGVNTIGRGKQDPSPSIGLHGLNISAQHAEIQLADGGNASIRLVDSEARLLVNGETVSEDVQLNHSDRIMIGTSHLYVLMLPGATNPAEPITFELAQEEISQNSDDEDDDSSGIDDAVIRDQLADFLPDVKEANAMSEALDKKVRFTAVVMTPQMLGKSEGKSEIHVKVTQLQTGYSWFWSKGKFINRKYAMSEMFDDFEEGEDWQVAEEKDPFIENPDTECLIGVTEVYIQCVTYLVEMKSEVNIVDYRGVRVGQIQVEILPSDENGNLLPENLLVDSPSELIGKRIDFKIVLKKGKDLPERFSEVSARYSLFTYEDIRTPPVSQSANVNFDHTFHVTVNECTQKHLDFLSARPVRVQIWGKQKAGECHPVNRAAAKGLSTKMIMRQVRKTVKKSSKQPNCSTTSDSMWQVAENVLNQKKILHLHAKLERIRSLCLTEEANGKDVVSIMGLRDLSQ